MLLVHTAHTYIYPLLYVYRNVENARLLNSNNTTHSIFFVVASTSVVLAGLLSLVVYIARVMFIYGMVFALS